MSDIKFYIPERETIPTKLRLSVDEISMEYYPIESGFRFDVLAPEDDALKAVEEVVSKMKSEHSNPQHGISWRTESLKVIPRDKRYYSDDETLIEWKYRVKDIY